jgi:hypothetical protein
MSAIQDISNHVSNNKEAAAHLLELMVYRPDLAASINKFAFTALLKANKDTARAVLAWAKGLPEGEWEQGCPDPARWLSEQIKQRVKAG